LSRSSADKDSTASASWRRVEADGSITLEVHVQPGAKRSEFVAMHGGCPKIRLAAPAIEGRANDALIDFIAAAFGVPKRNVVLIRGERSRRKTLRVNGPATRPDHDWAALN
jgi:uncharacterized protein (TIGR00251 family)